MQRLCIHYKDCGGCQIQDLPYGTQLQLKEKKLKELFKNYWDNPIPITPSPSSWFYRNKIELSFAGKQYPEPPAKDFQRETILGFNRKGKWFSNIENEECLIFDNDLPCLLKTVRQWTNHNHLHFYDVKKKQGQLRALLIRRTERTDQKMILLNTATENLDTKTFIEAISATYPVHSIYHGVHSGQARVVTAEKLSHIYGELYIYETLHIAKRELTFRISPFSFFQTNTLAAEKLYEKIREWINQSKAEVLYDFYGGSGGIALACSDLVSKIYSVECVGSASQDGMYNASTNQITNIEFITQPVENYLKEIYARQTFDSGSTVILDPPRAGLHPKALEYLIQLKSKEIIYVSCKASSFLKELPIFLTRYNLTTLEAFDLFPHTEQIELLVKMTLKA